MNNYDNEFSIFFLIEYFSSTKKFSRHLIFQLKDPFFDNIAVGKFVNLILEDIHGCLINHQCSKIINFLSTNQQFIHSCTCQLRQYIWSLETLVPHLQADPAWDRRLLLLLRHLLLRLKKMLLYLHPLHFLWRVN